MAGRDARPHRPGGRPRPPRAARRRPACSARRCTSISPSCRTRRRPPLTAMPEPYPILPTAPSNVSGVASLGGGAAGARHRPAARGRGGRRRRPPRQRQRPRHRPEVGPRPENLGLLLADARGSSTRPGIQGGAGRARRILASVRRAGRSGDRGAARRQPLEASSPERRPRSPASAPPPTACPRSSTRSRASRPSCARSSTEDLVASATRLVDASTPS